MPTPSSAAATRAVLANVLSRVGAVSTWKSTRDGGAMDTIIPDSDLVDRLRSRLGPRGVLTDPIDTAPYCEDWRRLYRGRTPAVLRPATTREVADAVRLCTDAGV